MRAHLKRYIRLKGASLSTILLSILIAGVLIAPLGSGELSVGMFMGFVTSTFGLAQMLSWDLTQMSADLANNREYLRDLSLFAQLSETPGATDAPAAPATIQAEPRRIEFRGVSFTYPGTERVILDNLSLIMHAKRHYAFVGANGAGKTTLTKLLTGLYDNYTGEILIDGKDLREYAQSELKAMFSIVYQDFSKYQIPLVDSVGLGNVGNIEKIGNAGNAKNIGNAGNAKSISNAESDCNSGSAGNVDGNGGIGNVGSDGRIGGIGNISGIGSTPERAIANAIDTLSLTEAVSKLPDGIRTPLGRIKENAVDLSGGEWQRIAIARSLVSGAPVHILDEPAAALDPVAESELYRLFAKISKGKTTVFITHRLGAARLAEEIFVIAGGRVAEQGAHDELIARNGVYAEMFEAQSGWYV